MATPSKVQRSGWTDDDGTGEYGTIINNAELQKVYDAVDLLISGLSPYTTIVLGGNLTVSGVITGNGSAITTLNAANIAIGIVNPNNLGSGGPTAAKVLRGDGTWQTLGTSGSTDVPFYPTPIGGNSAPAAGWFLNLIGAGATLQLPPCAANGGKVLGLVMKDAGSWLLQPSGADTLMGVSTPYAFNWPRYSTLVLKADDTTGAWAII